jgi:hypothetical protein
LYIKPRIETLSFIYNLEKRRIAEKHRSMARANYRLEAYATLRRRVAAVGPR